MTLAIAIGASSSGVTGEVTAVAGPRETPDRRGTDVNAGDAISCEMTDASGVFWYR
jgi:hypothetical protein